jgi:hypothetical protein
MGPLAILLIGGTIFYVYEKEKNPAWSPFTRLLSTPVDKVVALEKVKVTSVPTPSPTVALDPHMTTDQVKQVNRTLSSETDPKKIAAHAIALGIAGHDNSALALAAKANAVGEAKAMGAHDVDIHGKQIEAARATEVDHVPVPLDAPMTACEAQVLLNVLTSRQGHFDVEGIPVPLQITNVFDADTSHLIRVFQAEVHLPATGTMDADTAKALRIGALSPEALQAGPVATGWGPIASGSGGPIATGFYAHNFGGWSQPSQHGYHPWHHQHGWAGWPWHHRHGWHGYVGQRGREIERGRGRGHEFGREREFGHGREFGRGREHGRGREQYGEYAPHATYAVEEMPMHHHHRHLNEQQLLQQQEQEQQRLWHEQHMHRHHHHHHHHPAMPPQDPMAAQEAAPPAGMPIGGGGGASAMAAPLTVQPDHTADAGATTTQGWWFPDQPGSYAHDPLGLYGYDPGFGYEPGSLGRDPYWGSNSGFGGYGSIGFGGPGGLGGYGSWGSFGGWGHGL